MAHIGYVGAITKHKYSFGPSDEGGDRLIFLTGTITMSTGSATTTDNSMVVDLSGDIPNVENFFIQGDGGYEVEYNYDDTKIEIYQGAGTVSLPLGQVTGTVVEDLVFHFQAWGY